MHWVDFFIRDEYKQIFLKSIQYCQRHKSLEVYAYCIMTSHIHMIVRTGEGHMLKHVLRDLKSYTARCFHESLMDERNNFESRKDWMTPCLKIRTPVNFNSGRTEIIQ